MFSVVRSGYLRALSSPISGVSYISAARGIQTARSLRDGDKESGSEADLGKSAEAKAIEAKEEERKEIQEIQEKARNEAIAVKTASPEDQDKGKRTGRVGYKKWLAREGVKYKKSRPGATNWVGGRVPFPLNPFFRPRAPTSDETKEAVYSKYLEDPLKNTPRTIGESYGISIKRVEAIIKLKAIEHHMRDMEGFVPQRNLTKGMEGMLGVNSSQFVIRESLITEVPRNSAPKFYAVPEGANFTPEDAAEVLGRKPYRHILGRLSASKPYVVNYEGLNPKYAPQPQAKLTNSEVKRLESLGPAEEKVVSKDPALGNKRWKFVFTDIGKGLSMGNRDVLIREQDGTLKKAGRDYKIKRYGQIWPR